MSDEELPGQLALFTPFTLPSGDVGHELWQQDEDETCACCGVTLINGFCPVAEYYGSC